MSNTPQTTEDRADEAVSEYLRRVESGEVVNQEEFIASHPDVAEALRSYFAGERLMQLLVGSVCAESEASDSAVVSAADTGTVGQPDNTGGHSRKLWTTFPAMFGRYRVEAPLGEGAMGAVYRAHDTQLDRPVALKLPHTPAGASPETRVRLLREARSAAVLSHPNICRVFDADEIDGIPFITMELIDGSPLTGLIKPGQLPEVRRSVRIVRQMALALQAAHDVGIVHRDVKPANILIRRETGEPVLTDFGLAQKPILEGDQRLTQSGTIVGSPAYLSPEQARADLDGIGPASDQYSLGVVLYELLSGELPFSGSAMQTIAKILTAEPRSLCELRSEIPPALADICHRMLRKQPTERFATMKTVAAALEHLFAGNEQIDRQAIPITEGKSNPTGQGRYRASSILDRASATIGWGVGEFRQTSKQFRWAIAIAGMIAIFFLVSRLQTQWMLDKMQQEANEAFQKGWDGKQLNSDIEKFRNSLSDDRVRIQRETEEELTNRKKAVDRIMENRNRGE